MKGSYFSIDGLTSLARLIAAGGVIAIAAITCLDVVMRYFRIPIYGSYDIIRVIEGILISFSLLYTQSQQGHLSIELFVFRLGARRRVIIDLLNSAVSFLFMLLLTYAVLVDAHNMLRTNLLSMSLGLPLYPFAYAIALGCLMMCPRILLDFLTALRGVLRK